MSLNKGQLYQNELFDELKRNNKVPENITKTEQISGQDITVFNRHGESGIEVKLGTNVAFGSGTLKFDYSKDDNPWYLLESDVDQDNEEPTSSEIMKNIAKKYKLVEKVNKNWYDDNHYIPLYLEESNKKPIKKITSIPKRERGKRDFEVLHEFRIKCSKQDIEDYYTSKGSFYIQIGGKGLYWFGRKDPLQIASLISRFNPTEAYIRVRVQNKGSGRYNFSYGLYIKNIQKSKLDLDDDKNPSWLGYSGKP